MLILSNCLSKTTDEGCLKISNSLIKKIKNCVEDTYVVSYERHTEISDRHLKLNKFLLSPQLASIIKKRKQKVLYFPFPAKPISTAIRIFVLSLMSKFGLDVVITMQTKIGIIPRILLKFSRAKLIFLSADSFNRFSLILSGNRIQYIKTGVDTKKFVPIPSGQTDMIKEKYGLESTRPIVLHVGHLNQGRNVVQLEKISDKFQVVLVVSTLTKNEQDQELRYSLESCGIKIIDEYIPKIEEIYQMADVYFFPVVEYGKCIDVPLSCLEAAACNKPVVTTDYGEMKEFIGEDGFFFIDSFDKDSLIEKIQSAIDLKQINTRQAVLEYDWDNSILKFEK